MAISSEIRDSILFVTIVGDYQIMDFIEAILQGYAKPEFNDRTPVLIDARQSMASFSSHDMRKMKRSIIGQRPALHVGRWAMVAQSDPLRFGISRMAGLTMASMGVPVEIFTDIEKAVKYLRKP